jgi:hypothetical protein
MVAEHQTALTEAWHEYSAKLTDERVLDVRFYDASLIVDLMDGRTIAVPLAWYPKIAPCDA